MSVQKWRRKLSATEYINEAFNLSDSDGIAPFGVI